MKREKKGIGILCLCFCKISTRLPLPEYIELICARHDWSMKIKFILAAEKSAKRKLIRVKRKRESLCIICYSIQLRKNQHSFR